MAEVLGAAASVVTLVSLLTNCVEAFELIHIAKNQEKDLEKLDLKLMLEQCRLKAWGKSMGLISENGSEKRNLLNGFEFREVVQQALQQILTVLTDSNCLSKKYGGRQTCIEASANLTIDPGRSPAVSKLMAAFKRIKINDNVREQASKAKSTSVWVFHDRKKYMALISEVQSLVDTVEKLTKDIVSQAQQEQFMVSRINAISDLRTLNMVTEVCELDHPAYSDAASIRADVLSMTTSRRGDVTEWIEQVDAENAADDTSEDMESWDITELKRRYVTLRMQREEAQQDLEPTSELSRDGDRVFAKLKQDLRDFEQVTADFETFSTAAPDRLEKPKWIWHDTRTGRVWAESPRDCSPMTPPPQWAGQEPAMQTFLQSKAEEARRKLAEESTTQKALWATHDESMRNWLHTKSEEDRSKQEVERTRQLRLRFGKSLMDPALPQPSMWDPPITKPENNQGFVDGLSRKKRLDELELRFCRTVIEHLWSLINQHPFKSFGHPERPGVDNPAKSLVVEKPMGFYTIWTKCYQHSYQKAEDFEEDVRLVLRYYYDFPEYEIVNLCGRILVDFYYELIGMKEDWIAAMTRSRVYLPSAELSKDVFTGNIFDRADELITELYLNESGYQQSQEGVVPGGRET